MSKVHHTAPPHLAEDILHRRKNLRRALRDQAIDGRYEPDVKPTVNLTYTACILVQLGGFKIFPDPTFESADTFATTAFWCLEGRRT